MEVKQERSVEVRLTAAEVRDILRLCGGATLGRLNPKLPNIHKDAECTVVRGDDEGPDLVVLRWKDSTPWHE